MTWKVFEANRCWMKVKNGALRAIENERFCSQLADEYECSKGGTMRVRMWLCIKHVKKMENYGYTVRKV